MINLIHGDCMESMKERPDNYYDLAIVDPPYGIGQDGRNNHTRGKKTKSKNYSDKSRYDNKAPNPDYFDELQRISKNQIIWGANHFLDNNDNQISRNSGFTDRSS